MRVAWVELDAASRLIDQYRDSVLSFAEQNQTLPQSALTAGQADVTVLLDAQWELIDARGTVSDLERDAILGRIALEHAAGGTLIVPSPKSP